MTTKIYGSWTWANPTFQVYRNYYASFYYDVLKVVASVAGIYTFTNKASVGTYSYLYLPSFNAASPEENLFSTGYRLDTQNEYVISINLESDTAYYLVVTTSEYLQTGEYQLTATGPAKVTLTRNTGKEEIAEKSKC